MKCRCRYCGNELKTCMTDLGLSPLSNSYISEENIEKGQSYIPLKVFYCKECKLVQTSKYEAPESIFNSDYKYFSSYSSSWLKHSEEYVSMIIDRLNLNSDSRVMEIASNDGYLLQYFLKKGINPIGIEPSETTAIVAREKGINTLVEYFGESFAKKHIELYGKYDLILGNNVLAHVPMISDFVKGLKVALKPQGTVTMEFPHLLNLMKFKQFDTIYHEHFSYLSVLFLKRLFKDNGLKIYDIEKLSTHGGSLRIYVTHEENLCDISERVEEIEKEEIEYGLDKEKCYLKFNDMVKSMKYNTMVRLNELKLDGKKIVGYGAAAKGNTFFNYCGIKNETVDFIADLNPYKIGLFTPGALIPIVSPDRIKEEKPDYIIIIPWNLEKEIVKQLEYVREWGGKFIVLVPEIRIF